MNKIAVLIDFTKTCKTSINLAINISKKHDAVFTLAHVAPDSERNNEAEIFAKMDELAKPLADEGIAYQKFIDYGSFFGIVGMTMEKIGADLVIIGTHGVKGLKQNLFGSNILKLVQLLHVPSIVIQDHTKVESINFKRILFPIAPHVNFDIKIKQVSVLANIYGSKVVLLSIAKDLTGFSDEVQLNLKRTKAMFRELGVDYEHVSLEASGFSVGYARQTIDYAEEGNIDLISIMSNISHVNSYFGKVDKENILLNKPGIPVFCANDLE